MMISVQEAQGIILKGIKVLGPEVVKLENALGRALAEDVYSNSDIPSFDNSAMDGYAIRAEDVRGSSRQSPKALEVIGDIKAGDVPKKTVKGGQAMRIMTGAPVPRGADAVVMVEETEKPETRVQKPELVKIFKEVEKGENIRKAGEDIKRGECVFQKGARLTSAHIGLLASLGQAEVKVAKRPTVAVLATGDELIDVDEKARPGKIRSSNTYTLLGEAASCGAIPKNLGIAKDDPGELAKKIRKGLGCDILLTSGGVSVGDYDLVKDVLAGIGTDIKFWKIAMRPGKPLAFGTIKDTLVFGLPGNPVSSMVSFELFVRPAILKMLGQNDDKGEVDAVIGEDIEKKAGIRYFLRAITRWDNGNFVTNTTGPQGSGILKSMALANSLIVLPEEVEKAEKGDKVKVRFL